MSPKIRIAVSGVGGGVGQSIIKALSGSDYEVVALNGDELGAGLYAAAKSYIVPYAKDPSFVDRVLEICEKESCRLLFPGLDTELSVLAKAVDRFAQIGTQAIVSSPDVVELSDNKLLTYTTLARHGIHVPHTVDMAIYLRNQASLPPYPFVLKKREGGARSRDVYLMRNAKDLENVVFHGVDVSLFVAQEYIEGDEYTCGSINLDGECKGVIVMRRILRDGDTYKCFAVKSELIEHEVRKVMAAIKPYGACNVQLRLKNDKPYVFEINARCSGTTGARALCGFNEPLMIADYLCHQKEPSYSIKEQTILRYWKELVVPTELTEQLAESGELERDDYTAL
jgi:carbamoyl-phosphate synthase large subunit